jgi:uncharacterized protein
MLGEQALIAKAPQNYKVMRKIGLISDTHIPKRANCLPKRLFEIFEKVDFIIHAGDLVELKVIDELELIAPVLAVQGNMDSTEVSSALPILDSLKVFDWKIGVMHNPSVNNGFNQMRKLAQQHSFDVFVYGHTHTGNIKWEEKRLFINPGSPIESVSSMIIPSVGLLKIEKETITPELIEL